MMRTDRFDFSQFYLEHGYKEVAMPPNADGGFAIDPEALHIWPRGHFMLMALPNPDQHVYLHACLLPTKARMALPDRRPRCWRCRGYFEQHFPDVLAHLPDFEGEWAAHPTSSLVTDAVCSPGTTASAWCSSEMPPTPSFPSTDRA